jgi:hypothetical protein
MNRPAVIRVLTAPQPTLAEYRVEAVFVFGSVARNEASANSDVDLLVDFERPPSLFELARLRRALSGALGRPVDLVTRAALKPRLRDRILPEAVRAA